jgi:hypothetical protein
MSPIFLVLALLSEWIYTQNTPLPWGLTAVYISSRVVVVNNDQGTCVVAFRGTDSITDLLDDLITQSYQSCDGRVISGFMYSYHQIDMDVVKRSVSSVNCKQLYVTGHSLGGAMAEIAANGLSTLVVSPTTVVTFGCPRVCCISSDVTIDRVVTTRLVNRHDPITALPERFGTRDVAHCSGIALELPSMTKHDDLHWPPLSGHVDPLDHKISRYVKTLKEYINQHEY